MPRLSIFSSMKEMPEMLSNNQCNPYLLRDQKYYISALYRGIHDKESMAYEHLKQAMQMLLQSRLIRMSEEV